MGPSDGRAQYLPVARVSAGLVVLPAASVEFMTSEGRMSRDHRRTRVEECEVICASTPGPCRAFGIVFQTTSGRRGQRTWLTCPFCDRRMFKLYRPSYSANFACRACHNLTYLSVQQHDARLDRLLKIPEAHRVDLMLQDHNDVWKVLAIKAGFIRLGQIPKYF